MQPSALRSNPPTALQSEARSLPRKLGNPFRALTPSRARTTPRAGRLRHAASSLDSQSGSTSGDLDVAAARDSSCGVGPGHPRTEGQGTPHRGVWGRAALGHVPRGGGPPRSPQAKTAHLWAKTQSQRRPDAVLRRRHASPDGPVRRRAPPDDTRWALVLAGRPILSSLPRAAGPHATPSGHAPAASGPCPVRTPTRFRFRNP